MREESSPLLDDLSTIPAATFTVIPESLPDIEVEYTNSKLALAADNKNLLAEVPDLLKGKTLSLILRLSCILR